MKNISTIIFVILIVSVLMLYWVSFQVRETESALVTTFGKAERSIIKPGWYAKWPAPIQFVYKFDSRLRVYNGVIEETTTRGGEPIVVTAYVVWKIADPLKFFESVGTDQRAEEHLSNQIRDKRNSIIGQHYFGEFVNSDPNKIQFTSIEKEMKDELARAMRAGYGIEVKDVGMKQLGVSEKVTQNVFDRMTADRTRKTVAIESAGKAEAARIKADADSKKQILLAAAEARAKAIRGDGDAQAAQYYKKLEQNSSLAIFLRQTEALKNMCKDKTTIVISADSEPFKLLKQMPNVDPNGAITGGK
jgi:membrane protease subunit HflC